MAVGLLKIGQLKERPTKLNGMSDPYHVFSGALDTVKYDDITSNKNWMEIGRYTHDFLFCRNQVISWTYAQTTAIGQPFSGLTQEDQEYAAMYYAVGEAERQSVFSEEELLDHWKYFITTANETRAIRWKEAKSMISFYLSVADSIDMAKTTDTLSNEYITYGVEEYSADGVSGLFDWIEGTGPDYSGGTGFEFKSYYTTGLTQNLMTILRDGIY